MPYPNGQPTRQEQRIAWIEGGRVGPEPWPPCRTPAERKHRAEINALEKQLKLGRWAPRPVSDWAKVEHKRMHNLRRKLRVATNTVTPKRTGPTQLELAEQWIMGGRVGPPPRLILQQRAAAKRSQAKLKEKRRLARLAREESRRANPRSMDPLGRPEQPLTVAQADRLQAWFTLWDSVTVPPEHQSADDVPPYGVVRRRIDAEGRQDVPQNVTATGETAAVHASRGPAVSEPGAEDLPLHYQWEALQKAMLENGLLINTWTGRPERAQ